MTAAITPGSVQSLLDTNRLASLVYEAASKRFFAEARENGYPVSTATGAALSLAAADLHRTALAVVLKAPYGTTIHTSEGPLIIASRLNGSGTAFGDDEADRVVLTTDGWGAITNAWHEGKSRDSVYYERYDATGRVAHGWVDIESRKLTQTG